MSANNIQLITAAEANDTAAKLNAANIGGGVAKIYDGQDPAAGGEGSVFGPTVDASDPTAHLYMFKFENGALSSAGLCKQEIDNNPGRWQEMLAADINREAKKDE